MTRFLAALAVILLLTSCTGSSSSSPASSSTLATSAAPHLPAGIPPSFGADVGPENVPTAALIPLETTVTGSWSTTTSAGEAIVVAWESPGGDPFRRDRGVAVWRRFDDGGAPWRPVWGESFHARGDEPVLGLDAQIADVTGDGSPDALLFASTGGSGNCGTTSVVDLAAGSVPYRSTGCDRTIEPSANPVGLRLREAVYAPGDPHCCPSAFRESVLVYDNGAWQTATSSLSPT